MSAGMLTRGGLPQQMNRQVYPGQVPGQVSGQMGGRATPPAGLQPPFQGLAERALAGMEPYNNAQPKPQATTQQVSIPCTFIKGCARSRFAHSTLCCKNLRSLVLR